MTNGLINDTVFDVIKSDNLHSLLSFLINSSLSKKAPNDLYWLDVTEALSNIKSQRVCSIGFSSLGLDTPENSNIVIIESQIKVVEANDIGASIINDLESVLQNSHEKFDAVIISCTSLSAIFLLSRKLTNILRLLGSGNLVITINVNPKNSTDQITIQNEQLCFSEMMIRKVLHQNGFKRIRRNDDPEHTESWKHETKLITFNDELFRPVSMLLQETDNFLVKTYVCDLGLRNVF